LVRFSGLFAFTQLFFQTLNIMFALANLILADRPHLAA